MRRISALQAPSQSDAYCPFSISRMRPYPGIRGVNTGTFSNTRVPFTCALVFFIFSLLDLSLETSILKIRGLNILLFLNTPFLFRSSFSLVFSHLLELKPFVLEYRCLCCIAHLQDQCEICAYDTPCKCDKQII